VQLKRSEWVAVIVVGLFVVVLVGSSVFPALKGTPQRRCLENLKTLARSAQTYCADTTGQLPPAEIWTEAFLTRYVDEKSLLCCPAAKPTDSQRMSMDQGHSQGLPLGYAINTDVCLTYPGYMDNAKEVPLFFDSTVIAPNAAAAIDTLDLRHEGNVGNVVYVDGHAEALTAVPTPVAPIVKLPQNPMPASADEKPAAEGKSGDNSGAKAEGKSDAKPADKSADKPDAKPESKTEKK
jgi:prepilin-type processing-associated H-X9-DG protein